MSLWCSNVLDLVIDNFPEFSSELILMSLHLHDAFFGVLLSKPFELIRNSNVMTYFFIDLYILYNPS